jgi:hypothetical protein
MRVQKLCAALQPKQYPTHHHEENVHNPSCQNADSMLTSRASRNKNLYICIVVMSMGPLSFPSLRATARK